MTPAAELIAALMQLVEPARYEQPQLLWAIPALAALGLTLWLWCGREFRRRLRLFVSARFATPLLDERVLLYKRLRLSLVIMALMALCVSLARPIGAAQPVAANRQGVNLLIAIDGSRSMLAQDVVPNRFAVAQAGIESLLTNLEGDRAGMIFFAGESTLVAPLSFDTVSLQVVARGLDPELSGKGGSSLAAVIERAAEYLSRRPYLAKAVLVFSDGEETEGDVVIAAQDAYRKHGVRLFAVGVGTAAGASIPRMERDARRELVRVGTVQDAQGKPVQSRLNEAALRTAALVGAGAYVDLQEATGDLSRFYRESLKPLAAPMEEVPLQDPQERFQIPLATALALLVIEMLWPQRRRKRARARQSLQAPAAPVRSERKVAAAAVLLGLLVFTLALGSASSASTRIQRMFAAREFEQAFPLLQQALLAAPGDPLARYNYALGAYGAGKYSVAIQEFERLIHSGDPEVAERSVLQLGNSLYRLGEQMRESNPEGAVAQWRKALAAYRQATDQARAAHNFGKVQGDVVTLLSRLARTQDRQGDVAARSAPEKAIPAWRKALAYLDQALQVGTEEAPLPATVGAARERVRNKVFAAYLATAEDQRRLAELQQHAALESAIEQMNAALANYTEALAVKSHSTRAAAGRAAATRMLDPWVVRLADQQHEEGKSIRASFLDDAMALWKTAASQYAQVLARSPENSAARRGQRNNNRTLHDGYAALGDREQRRASEGFRSNAERDALLEQAVNNYRSALDLEPEDVATQRKLARLGVQLAGRFVERGQQELAEGKSLDPAKSPEAIAWLERSVQSFGKALAFEPANAAGLAGQKAAEELLRKLRAQDAEQQRKMLAQNRKLGGAEEIKDPGKLALKLLNYDAGQLAAKRQQNLSAPENRPVKDW
ncbi:MAG: VWA domain-containing protein [Steroidobacteraceae bacterium]